jgi:FKBP-type peptidyl-prolyl cis-trans isomerase FkpA
MTEITRVPLQPIAKGSLGKLWLGVAAVALAAGGIAYAALPPSLSIETIKAGSGASPTDADVVMKTYKRKLPDVKFFDEGQTQPMPMKGVIPGFTKALGQMQRGGKYKVFIPSDLGYGPKAAGPIPPNTDLTFEIELLDFKNKAEVEREMQVMQQLQQMQQMQGGAPQGAAPQGASPHGAMPGGAMPPGMGPHGELPPEAALPQ